MLKAHTKLFKGFQSLEKVYRDQHFYLERNEIHQYMLLNTEFVIGFCFFAKIFVAFICGLLQFYAIKRIVEKNQSNES